MRYRPIVGKLMFTAALWLSICFIKPVYAAEIRYGDSLASVTGLSEELYNIEEVFLASDAYAQIPADGEEELIIPQRGVAVDGPGWSTYVDAIWRVGGRYYNISNFAEWEIDKPNVADIEQGRIIGKAEGNAQITAKFKEKTFSFTVNVGGLAGNLAARASGSYTSSQREVLNRALDMINFTWTPARNVWTWKGDRTFPAGVKQTGVPYSQNYQRTAADLKNDVQSEDFYAEFRRKDGVLMPKYGNDCSGFVSIAWNIRRYTTSSFVAGIKDGTFAKVGNYDPNNPSAEDLRASYAKLKPGDALVKVGHVMLVESVEGETVHCYEQTPDYARVLDHGFDELLKGRYMPFSYLDSTNKSKAGIWKSATISASGGNVQSAQNGWIQSGGRWYLYENNVKKTGWAQHNGKWYFLGSSGAMATGWQQITGSWYYLKSDGSMAENEWIPDGGKWYYLGGGGKMLSTRWISSGNSWYYVRTSGAMMENDWRLIDGIWYFFDKDGRMLASTSRKIKGKTYHFNANGACTNP